MGCQEGFIIIKLKKHTSVGVGFCSLWANLAAIPVVDNLIGILIFLTVGSISFSVEFVSTSVSLFKECPYSSFDSFFRFSTEFSFCSKIMTFIAFILFANKKIIFCYPLIFQIYSFYISRKNYDLFATNTVKLKKKNYFDVNFFLCERTYFIHAFERSYGTSKKMQIQTCEKTFVHNFICILFIIEF